MTPSVTIVVPTSGRPSLGPLLEALAGGRGPAPAEVVVVCDGGAAPATEPGTLDNLRVLHTPGRGPAAARNAGWRAASADWIAFLDDDVVPGPDWYRRLLEDLEGLHATVAGSQGRVRVPLARGRRPTDAERNTKGLESAVWATADMAYRRTALASVGGFDERFPRAYREDADLGLRLVRAGWAIARGERWVEHPVRPSGALRSLRAQAGNADDVAMLVLHGPGWRRLAGVPRGRRPRHLAVAAAGLAALIGASRGRRGIATSATALYCAGVAELAYSRIAPGPRDPREVLAMASTSALLPAACALYWLWGWLRLPRLLRLPGPQPIVEEAPAAPSVEAVSG